VTAVLQQLVDIRVVVFDVYGTLLISGSGEVGTAIDDKPEEVTTENSPHDPIRGSCLTAGLTDLRSVPTLDAIRARVEEVNRQRRFETNPQPEVEILDIWRDAWVRCGRSDIASNPLLVAKIAAAVESRTNPTWPMPGAAEVIERLHRNEITMGIVSNAQFYTIELLENLISDSLPRRFDLNLCFFSNRYRASKPGPLMFDRLAGELKRRGIPVSNTLYVGNDMLNDVMAANRVGMKTALFAGDARSLRLRANHSACQSIVPEVVLTSWDQLLECLNLKHE